MASTDFEWPWQYQFPPFFTIQPNSDTRAKQLEAWKTLILDFHKSNKIYLLDITEAQASPLFSNKAINRKLNLEAISLILDELQKQGNVEWLDKQKQRCYVFWRTPEEWGKMIYKWAENNGLTNTVCTLYEITNGDDSVNEEFHDLDQGVLKKALITLEKEGRAELILDEDNEESSLIRLLPSAYQGGVHLPTNQSKANPLEVSSRLFQEIRCNGNNKSYSNTGKNVFMVFFGQFVTEEILNTRKPSCPPNYFNMRVPDGHDYLKTGRKTVPFIRSRYEKKSGKSSNNLGNNLIKQSVSPHSHFRIAELNGATAWIDGSAIYGSTRSETETLRAYKNGLLKSIDEEGLYPITNDGYLSYLSPARDIEETNTLCTENKNWDDEKCFNEARRWVIATLQNIIVNDWLPAFLGEELPEYTRYDPSIDPSISNSFQSAAMRFGHTLVPPAIHRRIRPNICGTDLIRLCDSYYNALETVKNVSIESLILEWHSKLLKLKIFQ
ncbi:vacuolar protein-sorting-associated protein 25 [Caerostris extrusa]|uniref:Vacuolar protein-sorting-associated protein 25 n=1 Tax=Caerostris extrusa TaxID=172846 RepID=A0AAV4V705_CAEEX|nr:vacuolar protein-sorting-associated protein 25 [Caerostris extrusa]